MIAGHASDFHSSRRKKAIFVASQIDTLTSIKPTFNATAYYFGQFHQKNRADPKKLSGRYQMLALRIGHNAHLMAAL